MVVAETGHPAYSSTASTATSTATAASATHTAGLGTTIAEMHCLERDRGVESCRLHGGRSELCA